MINLSAGSYAMPAHGCLGLRHAKHALAMSALFGAACATSLKDFDRAFNAHWSTLAGLTCWEICVVDSIWQSKKVWLEIVGKMDAWHSQRWYITNSTHIIPFPVSPHLCISPGSAGAAASLDCVSRRWSDGPIGSFLETASMWHVYLINCAL